MLVVVSWSVRAVCLCALFVVCCLMVAVMRRVAVVCCLWCVVRCWPTLLVGPVCCMLVLCEVVA